MYKGNKLLSIGSNIKKKKLTQRLPWAAALPIPVTALIATAIKLSLHSATFLQHVAHIYVKKCEKSECKCPQCKPKRTEILQPELQLYNPNSDGHESIREWRGATTFEMTPCCRAEMNVVDK